MGFTCDWSDTFVECVTSVRLLRAGAASTLSDPIELAEIRFIPPKRRGICSLACCSDSNNSRG